MSMAASDQISVGYAVPRWSPTWAVPEVRVPESEVHDQAIEYLRGVLLAWALREARREDLRPLPLWAASARRSPPAAGLAP